MTLLLERLRQRAAWRRMGLMLLSGLPAIAVLGYFLAIWGGLTPADVAHINQGGNPTVPAVVLSLLGLHSIFYVGFLLPTLPELLRQNRKGIAVVALLGLALALFPETTYDWDRGRATGIWILVERMPYLWDRISLLFLILTPFGAAFSFLWFRTLDTHWAWVFAGLLAAFIVIQSASLNAWQRYYDPLILMLLGLFAARIAAVDTPTALKRLRLAGPLLAGLLQFGITLYKLS